MSREYLSGPGAITQVPEYLRTWFGVDAPVLLVYGSGSFTKSGARDALIPSAGFRWIECGGITPNPEAERVRELADTIVRDKPVAIVAVGGGSVIDTAKAAIALASAGDLESMLENGVGPLNGAPLLIAVPTTAGSGSEATHFAVLYHHGQKYSLAHPHLRPAMVVLDPQLLESCPEGLWLESGADAICQGIESWWNRNATEKSRDFAEQALSRLVPALFSRDAGAMLDGAHLAGKAIDITKTTGGHALSYNLTIHTGLPHGLAVLAIMQMLVPLMDREFSFFTSQPVLVRLFSDYGATFPDAFYAYAEAVWKRYPIDAYIRQLSPGDLPNLVRTVNLQRLGNHPVTLEEAHIESVYSAVLARHAGRSGA